MGFKQKVVRYNDENGNRRREVVRHARPSIAEGSLKGIDVISFESQENGDIHIIAKSLVIEIFVEEEDPKYGTFKRVSTINMNQPQERDHV